MTTFNIEHILLFAIIGFLFYHLISSCGCRMNGFSVGSLSPLPSPVPPKIKLVPNKGTSKQLYERLQTAYNDPNSNGAFVSMIFNNPTMKQNFFTEDTEDISTNKIFLDGSGSIIHKDIYVDVFGEDCAFGFIWDTDWLEKKLVDCLFPTDAMTAPITHCTFSNNPSIDFCKLANTSVDKKTPDRCSQGLYSLINYTMPTDEIRMATNCNQKIKYVLKNNPPNREPLQKNETCFSSIENTLHKGNKKPHNFDKQDYNEAVILKDVETSGIEINLGMKKLNELNKPSPVALFYLYGPLRPCYNSESNYNSVLKVLKSTFTPDTVVIAVQYTLLPIRDGPPGYMINFDEKFNKKGIAKSYTTLDQMPGYNEV